MQWGRLTREGAWCQSRALYSDLAWCEVYFERGERYGTE